MQRVYLAKIIPSTKWYGMVLGREISENQEMVTAIRNYLEQNKKDMARIVKSATIPIDV